MKKVLTIAGSDSGGGAGIQADIKTITAHGVFAMSAITALTAQNTVGISEIYEVPPDFLSAQLDAVFCDIYPDAIKIGMVFSDRHVYAIAHALKENKAQNIVTDPVMVSTSGSKLMKNNTVAALANELLPISALVTPNIPEAQVLCGRAIKSAHDMECAAREIAMGHGCAVLIKGGHSLNDSNDYLYSENEKGWFESKRINNPNTHGTGCTLSAAIASNLAKGYTLTKAIEHAKQYLSGALEYGLDIGKGSGPMNHAFDIHSKFAEK